MAEAQAYDEEVARFDPARSTVKKQKSSGGNSKKVAVGIGCTILAIVVGILKVGAKVGVKALPAVVGAATSQGDKPEPSRKPSRGSDAPSSASIDSQAEGLLKQALQKRLTELGMPHRVISVDLSPGPNSARPGRGSARDGAGNIQRFSFIAKITVGNGFLRAEFLSIEDD